MGGDGGEGKIKRSGFAVLGGSTVCLDCQYGTGLPPSREALQYGARPAQPRPRISCTHQCSARRRRPQLTRGRSAWPRTGWCTAPQSRAARQPSPPLRQGRGRGARVGDGRACGQAGDQMQRQRQAARSRGRQLQCREVGSIQCPALHRLTACRAFTTEPSLARSEMCWAPPPPCGSSPVPTTGTPTPPRSGCCIWR